MTVKLLPATIIVAFLLVGCASKPQYRDSYTFPTIGTVATRGIGETLIEQATGLLATDIDVKSDTVVGKSILPKGPYKYYDQDELGIWFSEKNQYFYLRRSDGEICIAKTKECGPVALTSQKRLSSLSINSFQQTLLYNGRVGNRITFAYREFSNNLARAAFSNNVDYDITESTIVGYKGVMLEIVKATNTELTYKVLSGFSN